MTRKNSRYLVLVLVVMVALIMPAFAQTQTETQKFLDEIQNKAAGSFQMEDPLEETDMEDFPYVRLRSLDKITARTVTFEAQVGSTVTFGNIFIKVAACRKAAPVDEPESAAFLQIWQGAEEWVFSGWMFASSPGLSHMDHPVYDVWVLDCLLEKSKEPTKEQTAQELEEVLEGEGEIEVSDAPATPQESENLEHPTLEEAVEEATE
ncbi:DUF2155 domain-containing protein [Alphaproteobacteria bacterium]|nr:DUF2155 domain-containing protein [Alphaproteobacteria bacterium]